MLLSNFQVSWQDPGVRLHNSVQISQSREVRLQFSPDTKLGCKPPIFFFMCIVFYKVVCGNVEGIKIQYIKVFILHCKIIIFLYFLFYFENIKLGNIKILGIFTVIVITDVMVF